MQDPEAEANRAAEFLRSYDNISRLEECWSRNCSGPTVKRGHNWLVSLPTSYWSTHNIWRRYNSVCLRQIAMQNQFSDHTCKYCFYTQCLDDCYNLRHIQCPPCRAEIVTKPARVCLSRIVNNIRLGRWDSDLLIGSFDLLSTWVENYEISHGWCSRSRSLAADFKLYWMRFCVADAPYEQIGTFTERRVWHNNGMMLGGSERSIGTHQREPCSS